MEIYAIRKLSKHRYEVESDEDSFVLSSRDLDELGLHPMEINEDEGGEPLQIAPQLAQRIREVLRLAAVRKCGELLKLQDYTEKRLRERLLHAGIPGDAADAAIQEMKDAHYLDDDRFAQTYIRYHLRDRSQERIRQDLRIRGVGEETAESAFAAVLRDEGENELREREKAQIRMLLTKRNFDPASDWNEQQKQKAYLFRKGYPMELIREVMKEAANETGMD